MSEIIRFNKEWNKDVMIQLTKKTVTGTVDYLIRKRTYKWLAKNLVLKEFPPYGFKIICGKDFFGTVFIELDTNSVRIDYTESSKEGRLVWNNIIPQMQKTFAKNPSEFL